MEGTAKADYGRCVDIVPVASLKAMVLPGLLAIGTPAAVGFLFRYFRVTYGPGIGAESVAAMLMVGTIGGILMATLMNNGGSGEVNRSEECDKKSQSAERPRARNAPAE